MTTVPIATITVPVRLRSSAPTVRFLVLCLWLFFAGSLSRGQSLSLVNASTNLLLGVQTGSGLALAPPGVTLPWPVVALEGFTNFCQNTNAGSGVAMPGHDYLVTVSADGHVDVMDKAAAQTRWFWLGLSTVGVLGVSAWGASWVKRVVGGHGVE